MLNSLFLVSRSVADAGAEEIPSGFVVLMGIGTVFVGLIFIILICLVTGALYGNAKPKKKPEATRKTAEDPRKRQEIIAAVCAACAEDMGTEVDRLRVVSFRKIS